MAKVCKFQVEKQQASYDCGESWVDTGEEPRKIEGREPVEKYSPDCGWSDSFMYEWFTVDNEYICSGYHKYTKKMQKVSYNLGEEWEIVEGSEQIGELVEKYSPDCCQLRSFSSETCDEHCRLINAVIEEASLDGQTWIQTGRYQVGEIIDYPSVSCMDEYGISIYGKSVSGDDIIVYTDYDDLEDYRDYGGIEVIAFGSNYDICGKDIRGYSVHSDSQDTLKKIKIASGFSQSFAAPRSKSGGNWVGCFEGFTELTELEGLGESKIPIIETYTFKGCTSLTSVEIPETCSFIGGGAFAGCTSLSSVTINSKYLGDSGPTGETSQSQFSGCISLKNVTFPNDYGGIIPSDMFSGCTSLSAITLGNPIEIRRAFIDCTALKSINLGNSLEKLGSFAFIRCTGLTSIEIPESCTDIGRGAFADCTSLSSVTINSKSLTASHALYDNEFSGCTALTSVVFPNDFSGTTYPAMFNGCTSLSALTLGNPTSVGSSTFTNCVSLTSVDLGNSITSIDDHAFSGCSGLRDIYITSTNQVRIGDYAFPTPLSDITAHVPCSMVVYYENKGFTVVPIDAPCP